VIDSLDLCHERMTATAGDFFVDPLPVADAYVLMEVLHDWTDEECVEILRAIRRAAHDGARLLIIEWIISEEQPDPRASVLDIVILTVTGGRERTTNELSVLFERARFCLDKVIATANPMRIVEARPI
jgi:C-methyltransferase